MFQWVGNSTAQLLLGFMANFVDGVWTLLLNKCLCWIQKARGVAFLGLGSLKMAQIKATGVVYKIQGWSACSNDLKGTPFGLG